MISALPRTIQFCSLSSSLAPSPGRKPPTRPSGRHAEAASAPLAGVYAFLPPAASLLKAAAWADPDPSLKRQPLIGAYASWFAKIAGPPWPERPRAVEEVIPRSPTRGRPRNRRHRSRSRRAKGNRLCAAALLFNWGHRRRAQNPHFLGPGPVLAETRRIYVVADRGPLLASPRLRRAFVLFSAINAKSKAPASTFAHGPGRGNLSLT